MAEHGPLVIFAAVLIVSGMQLLALGLLGEMIVRYHHEDRSRSSLNGRPYTICAQSHVSTNVPGSTETL